MGSIRILLVDDHQVVREGLRRMLELEDDIEVVSEAASVEEALTQAEVLSPDIVLMNIKMPGKNAIEATRLLKERQPDCKIIMPTLYEEYLAEAIQAGAVGCLLKDVKREELISAIRAVQQGRAPLSPFSRELFTEFVTSIKGERSSLSERELEILRLIANGATTEEIGAQLFLSEASVKRDVHGILDKLGVRNRSEAVAEANKRKLVSGTAQEAPPFFGGEELKAKAHKLIEDLSNLDRSRAKEMLSRLTSKELGAICKFVEIPFQPKQTKKEELIQKILWHFFDFPSGREVIQKIVLRRPEEITGFQEARAFFEANRERLLAEYEGKYIAILNNKVIGASEDFSQLAERVYSRWGYQDIYMPKVERERERLNIPSPRLK